MTENKKIKLCQSITINMLQGGTWESKSDKPERLIYNSHDYQIRSIKIDKRGIKTILYIEYGTKNNPIKHKIICSRVSHFNWNYNTSTCYFFIQDKTVRVSPRRLWKIESKKHDDIKLLYDIINDIDYP